MTFFVEYFLNAMMLVVGRHKRTSGKYISVWCFSHHAIALRIYNLGHDMGYL